MKHRRYVSAADLVEGCIERSTPLFPDEVGVEAGAPEKTDQSMLVAHKRATSLRRAGRSTRPSPSIGVIGTAGEAQGSGPYTCQISHSTGTHEIVSQGVV